MALQDCDCVAGAVEGDCGAEACDAASYLQVVLALLDRDDRCLETSKMLGSVSCVWMRECAYDNDVEFGCHVARVSLGCYLLLFGLREQVSSKS